MSEVSSYPTEGVIVSEAEAVGLFLANLPQMIHRARRARSMAPSYRVQVGSSGYSVNPYTGETLIRSRGNLKPTKVQETRCSERRTVEALENSGAIRTIGQVVIGPMDPETIISITDVSTETLHPCWRCRAELTDYDSVTDDMLVVTGGGGIKGEPSNANVFQVHTLGQIKNLYRNPNNIEDNQDTPIVNVQFRSVPAVYDNLMKEAAVRDLTPQLTAIRALHLLSS